MVVISLPMQQEIRIGWTTLGSIASAEALASEIVEAHLAACVQIEALSASVYRWEGKVCQEKEWRLTVKFPLEKAQKLEAFLKKRHPYDCPVWIVVRPESVAPEYLKWACARD